MGSYLPCTTYSYIQVSIHLEFSEETCVTSSSFKHMCGLQREEFFIMKTQDIFRVLFIALTHYVLNCRQWISPLLNACPTPIVAFVPCDGALYQNEESNMVIVDVLPLCAFHIHSSIERLHHVLFSPPFQCKKWAYHLLISLWVRVHISTVTKSVISRDTVISV